MNGNHTWRSTRKSKCGVMKAALVCLRSEAHTLAHTTHARVAADREQIVHIRSARRWSLTEADGQHYALDSADVFYVDCYVDVDCYVYVDCYIYVDCDVYVDFFVFQLGLCVSSASSASSVSSASSASGSSSRTPGTAAAAEVEPMRGGEHTVTATVAVTVAAATTKRRQQRQRQQASRSRAIR